MKTPRDILLARHQAAAPKLDDIRCEVVRQLNNKETKEQSQAPFFVAWLLGCLNLAGIISAEPSRLERPGGGMAVDSCRQHRAARAVARWQNDRRSGDDELPRAAALDE